MLHIRHSLGTDTCDFLCDPSGRGAKTPLGQFVHAGILGTLTVEETQEWHAGMAQAVAEGTYFIAQAHHCAVGTKPETVG